jgi:hypothetical protein
MRNRSVVAHYSLALVLVAVGLVSVDRVFPKDGPAVSKFKTVAESLIVVP